MPLDPRILFVCEHGAAKSIVAAACFNRLSQQLGRSQRAIARGINPDPELSPQAVQGLTEDGLTPTESRPQTLTEDDLHGAHQIVTFCELPVEYRLQVRTELWDDVPPVSENYKRAREVIVERIRRMLDQ